MLLTRSQGIQRLVEPSQTEPPVTRKHEVLVEPGSCSLLVDLSCHRRLPLCEHCWGGGGAGATAVRSAPVVPKPASRDKVDFSEMPGR